MVLCLPVLVVFPQSASNLSLPLEKLLVFVFLLPISFRIMVSEKGIHIDWLLIPHFLLFSVLLCPQIEIVLCAQIAFVSVLGIHCSLSRRNFTVSIKTCMSGAPLVIIALLWLLELWRDYYMLVSHSLPSCSSTWNSSLHWYLNYSSGFVTSFPVNVSAH